MFYITTPNGISITESGRAPLFIGKNHPEFKNVQTNIKNMTYNQVQDVIDIKNKVVGFINENTEMYFNNDDDLEVQVNVKDMSQRRKDDYIDDLVRQIKDGDDEDELSDKAKHLIKLLKENSLNLVGIKLIFE